MIEIPTGVAITATIATAGLWVTLGTLIFRLGSRLSKGSEKIATLEKNVAEVERDLAEMTQAITKSSANNGQRFQSIELKLTEIATVLTLLHADLTGGKLNLNLNGDKK